MVPVALAAAESVDASVEVIDLRTLFPWDRETVLDSVRRTGRLLVVQEPQGAAGVASDVAAVVAEQAIFDLAAPIRRVTGFDVPWPQFHIERHGLVDADRVRMELESLLAD
jgi:pyruvate/2-oxoglutarate/acetoin dehydrogenase E1 component